MVIEKELFLEGQRERILVTKKAELRLPLNNSWSCSILPSIDSNIFISQQKLKYKGAKKPETQARTVQDLQQDKKTSSCLFRGLVQAG